MSYFIYFFYKEKIKKKNLFVKQNQKNYKEKKQKIRSPEGDNQKFEKKKKKKKISSQKVQ